MTIDLNCDMGELPDVPEAEIMPFVTSANVACGAHAGDEQTMERTLLLAREHQVSCGAHPGYPNRANFGREEMALSAPEIARTVHGQVSALARVAERTGVPIVHVKPHGALYNVAVRKPEVARAIAEGVALWRRDVVLVGLAGSSMLDVWRNAGFKTAAEAFADRAYEPDGTLRSRKLSGALITDPAAAASQAIEIAMAGKAQTICIHSDTAGATAIVKAVRTGLEAAGIQVAPLALSYRVDYGCVMQQEAVLAAEREFFDALIGARIDVLEQLLADDFILTDLRGGSSPKRALLAEVASGVLRFESIEPADVLVRFYGGTAIVTGRTQMTVQAGADHFVFASRYTHVYVEQSGRTRLVTAQGTPIQQG